MITVRFGRCSACTEPPLALVAIHDELPARGSGRAALPVPSPLTSGPGILNL